MTLFLCLVDLGLQVALLPPGDLWSSSKTNENIESTQWLHSSSAPFSLRRILPGTVFANYGEQQCCDRQPENAVSQMDTVQPLYLLLVTAEMVQE